jgi:hypothetical protein
MYDTTNFDDLCDNLFNSDDEFWRIGHCVQSSPDTPWRGTLKVM